MRLLLLTPELPNELHRIRALNLLRGLGRRHEIDLVSLTHHPPRPEAVDALRPFCRRVDWVVQPRWRSWAQSALGLVGPTPLEVCYEYSPSLQALVRERLATRRYDMVYVKRLRMAHYVVDARELPRILDLTDAMTRYYDLAWRRARWSAKALFWEEWLKHRGYEPRMAARFDRTVVASRVDAEYLREQEGLQQVEVVPNAVDTDHFQEKPGREETATFLLSGLMDKLVNVDAALYLHHEIWPRVRASIPSARLRLVGPLPDSALRALDGRDGVEVVGMVSDLRDEMARATAVLVPLRIGTGTKNKVLQALAMGRAVVTTSVGNEGLDTISGRDLLIADGPAEFAAAVTRLQDDPDLRRTLGARGRSTVLEHYSLTSVVAQVESLMTEVVQFHREHSVWAARQQ